MEPRQTPTRPKRPWRGAAIAAVASIVLTPVLYIGGAMLTGNIHAVAPGEVYRSAQPSAKTLERLQAAYGLRSVINLRGENAGSPWYDEEVAASRRLGLAHFDFRMSAKTELSPAEAEALLALMEAAPKPLLIHCQSGADRTGLAAALYVAAVKRWGEAAAEAQLSLLYGHVAAPFAKGWAMTSTFEALEPALGYPDS
mgnify:CR=1 FL=1